MAKAHDDKTRLRSEIYFEMPQMECCQICQIKIQDTRLRLSFEYTTDTFLCIYISNIMWDIHTLKKVFIVYLKFKFKAKDLNKHFYKEDIQMAN